MTKEDLSITYENNIFYCTKNNTKWISVDGEKWYGEEKRIADLEQQIADIKANCDLAIEGRDIKIKELEQENAELKEQFKICEGNADTYYDQLTIAKDLIHQFLIQNPISDWLPKKAEQFLKEIEK